MIHSSKQFSSSPFYVALYYHRSLSPYFLVKRCLAKLDQGRLQLLFLLSWTEPVLGTILVRHFEASQRVRASFRRWWRNERLVNYISAAHFELFLINADGAMRKQVVFSRCDHSNPYPFNVTQLYTYNFALPTKCCLNSRPTFS